MDFNEIKELIGLIDASQLRSFELNLSGTTLKMSKNSETEVSASSTEMQAAEGGKKITLVVADEKDIAVKEPEKIIGNVVKAPIVGTFYTSSAPDKPIFAKIGDSVKKGDVLCVIEAMKVMNEVVSEFDGVIKAIMADNEALVEYGQPLFTIA